MKRIIYAVIYFMGMDWLCKKYFNFSPLAKAKETVDKIKNKQI